MDRAEPNAAPGGEGKSKAWHSGRHCGHLITKPLCPFKDLTEANEWEQGFLAGRQDLQKKHMQWLEDRKKNDGPR